MMESQTLACNSPLYGRRTAQIRLGQIPFRGGTGTISTAVVRRLADELGWEVWRINRGNRKNALPAGVHQIITDINDETTVSAAIQDMTFAPCRT